MKSFLDIIVPCPACMCMVHPKKVKRVVRDGKLIQFYQFEYDCPKCGERRIYDENNGRG